MMETIERLEKAVDFLSSTGSDCLGIGTDGQIEWSLRDELIDSLNKIRADVKALQAERDRVCQWTVDTKTDHLTSFVTGCGRMITMTNKQTEEFPYCPYCGGKIEVTEL